MASTVGGGGLDDRETACCIASTFATRLQGKKKNEIVKDRRAKRKESIEAKVDHE